MAVIKNDYGKMAMPLAIERGNAIPLDSTSVWTSLEEAQEYAASGSTAYVGQVISVIDTESEKVDVYGLNGTTDRSMQNDNDIARIQYVLDNYDFVEKLEKTSKEYRDKNGKPAPLIKFSKRIDGTYYVVEAVPETNRRKLEVVSAYKNQVIKKETSQQTVDVQAPTQVVRNVSADNVSNVSIPQKTDDVNDKNNDTKSKGVAQGYGKNGAKAFDAILQTKQVDQSEVQSKFRKAYEIGYMGIENAEFASSVEQKAYEAGKADLEESINNAISKSNQAKVYSKNGGVIVTEASKKVNNQELSLMNELGKTLGTKIQYAEQVFDGRANGSYQEGKIIIALDRLCLERNKGYRPLNRRNCIKTTARSVG